MDSSLRVSLKELEAGGPACAWQGAADSEDELASLVCEGDISPRSLDGFRSLLGSGPQRGSSEELAAEDGMQCASARGTRTDPLGVASLPFRERLLRAVPAKSVRERLQWVPRLAGVDAMQTLAEVDEPGPEAPPGGAGARRRGVGLNVNSGGQVFFGLLTPASTAGAEEAVVLKFCNSRHLLQSEQMSAELAWHLGVAAPQSRILLKARDAEEWQELAACAGAFCHDLAEIMSRKQSMLLLQFIPGANFEREVAAWEAPRLADSAHALGRLLILDLLLGNTDRIASKSLGWRGNPSNVLWSSAEGFSGPADRCTPIDAAVARRPPKLLVEGTDSKAAELLELLLLDRRSAHQALVEAVSCNAAAVAAIEADWAPNEAAWAKAGRGDGRPHSAVKGFHEGVRCALEAVAREQGLLEMVADVVSSWFRTFWEDMRQVSKPGLSPSQTKALKEIDKDAAQNAKVRDRLAFWQALLQDKSRLLAEAAQDWALRRSVDVSLSFKGFLGSSVLNPVADAYELLVRVQQLAARGKVMAKAAQVTRPSDLAPSPLFVGPVTSLGYHLLRKLGVTCIINCSEDLPPPPPEAAWHGSLRWHRLTLADVEEQDLASAFEDGLKIIDEVVEAGGRVLVHCHEGKSRSVSLCLAYLVTRERRTLADAFAFVKSKRPPARPNAGFMKQLLKLELETLGANSMGLEDLPKGKPKMLKCDECGAEVGLTEEALAKHKRLKHQLG